MNATQQQGPQLPPREEMIEARDSLRHFLNSKGYQYLSSIFAKQVENHRNHIAAGIEGAGDKHPMAYVLGQEYAKGVLQGIMISAQLASLLVEQLNTDLARTAEEPK